MDELTLLRDFFRSWEDMQSLPSKKGAPDLEHKTARECLNECAKKVKEFRTPKPKPEINDLRMMQQQIAAIQPKDGTAKGVKWP